MKAAWALALVVAVTLVVAVVAVFVGRFREHKAPIGIDISMESGALRLSFSPCGWWRGEPALNLLDVVELRPPDAVLEECELVAQREPAVLLPQSWRYGTLVAGFQLVGCDSLRPGRQRPGPGPGSVRQSDHRGGQRRDRFPG